MRGVSVEAEETLQAKAWGQKCGERITQSIIVLEDSLNLASSQCPSGWSGGEAGVEENGRLLAPGTSEFRK